LAVSLSLVVGATAAVTLGGVGAGVKSPSSPTYFQDVKPILDGRCSGCHFRGGIGPFPLTSYADAHASRAAVAQAVRTRAMPPWHAKRGVRRYLHDPSLTDAQIAAVVRWVQRGAPRGDARRPGRSLAPIRGGLSRVDLRLTMPIAYTPTHHDGHDDYRCFPLDWTPTAPTFVTGADVSPGVRAEVHHIIVYLAPPAAAGSVAQWDASDPEPGYRCYGGPSATGRQALGINFLTGWAPGAASSNFPAGTGQRVEPGSRLVMQVHYNVGATAPRPDRSTVRLSLAPAVDRRAVYLPVVDLGWVLSPQTFRLQAGRERIVHSFTGDPTPVVRFLGGFDPSRGFTMHSAALHMHRLGKSAQLVLERASGKRELLLEIARWDFDWQRDYRFAAPVVFGQGDRLTIRCTHDNSRANQPFVDGRRAAPRLVTWGEDSSDEMCIGFVYVAER
jgi:mono/diheme cytochrome c family protein